jgi:hypothetical protein
MSIMAKMMMNIAIAIIMIAIAGSMLATSAHGSKPFNPDYCKNWSDQIDKRRAELENSILGSIFDADEFQRDVDEYNRECAY